VIEKLKRRQTAKKDLHEANPDKELEEDLKSRFPFRQDDLRYYIVKKKPKRELNAAVICVMDTSGSMDSTKK
ncbi:DUF444 family protein, partial [Clostridium butyricum]|nr:DUF444 family protein [Clostridium butyricum]